MSEPIWCYVRFRIPPTWGEPALVEGLSEALLNGEALLGDDGEWVVNGEGNYGLYDDEIVEWLDWMRLHSVPFLASCEAKYEFEGESIVNDGSHEWSGTSGVDQALLSKSEYAGIVTGASQFRTVDEFFEILNTSSTLGFSIDHLPTDYPGDSNE